MLSWGDLGVDTRGATSGQIKTLCPKCSRTRKKPNEPCLSVNLDDGVAHCHNCGESYSLNGKKVIQPKFRIPDQRVNIDMPPQFRQYIADRGISHNAVNRLCVGVGRKFFPSVQEERDCFEFPYFRSNQIVNIKSRTLDKEFVLEKEAEIILYGLNDIIGQPVAIWVEGEFDKLAFETAGIYPVVSVPNGANTGKMEYLANCENEIQPIQKHILAVDNDEKGRQLQVELAKRLDPKKCYYIQYPDGCKDANDILLQYGPEVLQQLVNDAVPFPIEGIIKPNAVLEDIFHISEHGTDPGLSTGWMNLDRHYRVKTGQWTVVTGIPSHGKSTFLDALMENLCIKHDWNIAYYSPENFPITQHVIALLKKYIGKPFGYGYTGAMSQEEVRIGMAWIQKHFTFLNSDETTLTLETILELAKVTILRDGIKGLVIDPWNELDHARPSKLSETEYISQALRTLRMFARKYDIHVWLVAHPQKPQKDKQTKKFPVPTLYDVSGCHSADTEVLTSDGWVPHPEVTLNHNVACFDPKTETMSYQAPEKIWEYDYDGEMYNFKSPSYDALVTPNHRMIIRPVWNKYRKVVGSGKGRPFKYSQYDWNFTHAAECTGNFIMPWSTDFVDGADIEMFLDYPADLIIRFLGWYISEGWVYKGSRGLGVCQGVGGLAMTMVEVMFRCGIEFSTYISKPGTNGSINGWKAYIGVRKNRELCEWVPENCGVGSANKKIPEFIWGVSTRQKELLLMSLIEGDGSKCREDTYSYSTTSKQLADDVQRLAIECGRMSSLSPKMIRENSLHSPQYQVNIGRKNRTTIAIRSSRNLLTEHYSGKVYCLTVPTGAYLVRRNGKPGIYGNSAHWYNKADNGLVIYKDPDEPENAVQIHVQKVRFRDTGKPGKVDLTYEPKNGRFLEG